MKADDKHLYSFVGSHICCHVVRCVTMASVCELIWETPFSCDLVVPRRARKRVWCSERFFLSNGAG